MRRRWIVSFAGAPVLEVEEVEVPRVLPPERQAEYDAWRAEHAREFRELWLTIGRSDFNKEIFDGHLLALNVMRDLIEMYADCYAVE